LLQGFNAWRVWSTRQKDALVHSAILQQKNHNLSLLRHLEAHQQRYEVNQAKNSNFIFL